MNMQIILWLEHSSMNRESKLDIDNQSWGNIRSHFRDELIVIWYMIAAQELITLLSFGCPGQLDKISCSEDYRNRGVWQQITSSDF